MSNTKLRHAALSSPKQLYKFLLRECDKLPKDACQFYKHSIKQVVVNLDKFKKYKDSKEKQAQRHLRQSITSVFPIYKSFKQHLIEPDKERVRQIMEKAVQDAEWLINKYSKLEDGKTLKK